MWKNESVIDKEYILSGYSRETTIKYYFDEIGGNEDIQTYSVFSIY